MLFTWPVLAGSLGLSGFAPLARGTVGTAVCLLAALALWRWADWHLDAWLPLAAAFTGLSLLAGRAVLNAIPKIKDPGWFVLDEAAAFFLTLGLLRADSLLAIFAGFLTFRFYDIAKPWPVRSFEQIPGSLGILMDDLAAAVLAAWTWYVITALGSAVS
jgi:phosphatidylglycerophosphatase A